MPWGRVILHRGPGLTVRFHTRNHRTHLLSTSGIKDAICSTRTRLLKCYQRGVSSSRSLLDPDIDDLLERMTVAEKVGQMVMVLNAPGWPGVSNVETLVGEHGAGSVISCAYHALNPVEAASRNNHLQELARRTRLGIPLLNGGDFEQGLPSQMPGAGTGFPHQMGLGAAGDVSGAERAALIAGQEERALGFHWSFSPCADVNTNPLNPVIGVRSFGAQTAAVAELTRRQVLAYRGAGVLATAKHFPGHGDTRVDSHRGLPVIAYDLDTLYQTHLPPFRAAIAAGVPAVMTGHVIVPPLDPDLPATLSPRLLTGLLRGELGFDGIVITDLMSMGAIAGRWPAGEAAVQAARAGADVIMAAGPTEVEISTLRTLVDAVQAGELTVDRVDSSVRRILMAKRELGLWQARYVDVSRIDGYLGAPASCTAADDLARRSITLLRNDGTLPFTSYAGSTTLVAGTLHRSRSNNPSVGYTALCAAAVHAVSGDPVLDWQAASNDPTGDEVAAAVELAARADRVLVFTYACGGLPEGQRRLVGELQRTGKPLAVVSTGLPYDIMDFPDIGACLASYALGFVPQQLGTPAVLRAAVDVAFGAPPRGKLPVPVPGLYPVGHGLTYA